MADEPSTTAPIHTPRYALTIMQTAEALSLGRSSVYGLIGSGQLTAVKAGRRTLITVQSIEKLIGYRHA